LEEQGVGWESWGKQELGRREEGEEAGFTVTITPSPSPSGITGSRELSVWSPQFGSSELGRSNFWSPEFGSSELGRPKVWEPRAREVQS